MSNNCSIYRLKTLGLPAIDTIEGIASAMCLSESKIKYLAYQSEYFYKVYDLPKKNGGKRTIAQPNRELKAIQAWILRNILDKLSSSEHCKGFEKGTSILDNALPHVGANYVLTMDLENFFPNIRASGVYTIFNVIGYNPTISSIFTNLCTYKNGLPQGAPTSPKLANLVCAKLDARLHGYAGSKGIVYTRYADDLTLSGQTPQKIYKAAKFIRTIITDERFHINEQKTVIAGTKKRKEITGLVVSESCVGIGREKYRDLRSKIHRLFVDKNVNFSHVNGVLSFLYSVDKKYYKKIFIYIKKLSEKYPNSSACRELASEIKK